MQRCGACAHACHEGAIGIIDGKAILLRDDYCDGLGDCLPSCPMQAISFVEREAKPYDEQAVLANQRQKQSSSCPGKQAGFNGELEISTAAVSIAPSPSS